MTCAETLETLCALTDEFPFCDAIRQDEKKLLRVWNAGKGFEQRAVRFPVMQQGRARGSENDVHENKQGQQGTENTEPTNNNPKPQMAPKPPKPVVATAIRAPAEKLFVLAQVCLSEFGTVAMASAPERTKLDAQRFMNRAPQLAAGAFAVFSQKIKNPNTFAASFSAPNACFRTFTVSTGCITAVDSTDAPSAAPYTSHCGWLCNRDSSTLRCNNFF